MSTWREIVYECLDEIKAISDDSTVTEEHVIFLANQYRSFLLEQKRKAEKESELSQANYQVICLTLEQADAIDGLDYCNDLLLRSVEEIPDTITKESSAVYTADRWATRIAYITKERFKFVGYNKWLKNITYVTLGEDNHLYFKSSNPQFLYLTEAKMSAIFDDAEKAAELACDEEGKPCDILDQDFPMESSLIPQMLEFLVKELTAFEWHQQDDANNANDDLGDLMTYLRQNVKSDLAKQLSA